jgi:hypothetical protein
LRDLDTTNPAFAKPERFASLGAILLLIFSAFSLALAEEAAPSVPYSENPILLFLSLILAIGSGLLCVPRIFRWNWDAKYFGVTLFQISSIALMCLVPCFCVVAYSKLPIGVRLGVLFMYTGIHVAWCWRFVVFYSKITNDITLRRLLYQEEADAVYYMQRGDKHLLETQYKFHQLPQDRYFVIFMLLAFALVPIMDKVRAVVGLPFTHIFLMIGTLPISLMGVGFAARGWLVFYVYPREIKKATGKRVYVDMSGKPNFIKPCKGAKTE